jgi:hypothetical protein
MEVVQRTTRENRRAGVRGLAIDQTPALNRAMGTTFITLTSISTAQDLGFWMRDNVLELWLRLLALHLPEPKDNGEHQTTFAIRNRWLLASRYSYVGCVPHGMEEVCATSEGRQVVRLAIESLLAALDRAPVTFDPQTLNLLGMADDLMLIAPIERRALQGIGQAFLDLLDGKINGTCSSTAIMPGSKPYPP